MKHFKWDSTRVKCMGGGVKEGWAFIDIERMSESGGGPTLNLNSMEIEIQGAGTRQRHRNLQGAGEHIVDASTGCWQKTSGQKQSLRDRRQRCILLCRASSPQLKQCYSFPAATHHRGIKDVEERVGGHSLCGEGLALLGALNTLLALQAHLHITHAG
jgi:hypothetical protein